MILLSQHVVSCAHTILMQILRIPGLWVPLVNLEGVYILPGIPRLFCRMVEAHKERFQGPAASSRELFTDRGEGDLAGIPRTYMGDS